MALQNVRFDEYQLYFLMCVANKPNYVGKYLEK